MDPYCLKKLNQARRDRIPAVLVTDIADGRDRVVLSGDHVAGQLGEQIGRAFSSGRSAMIRIEDRQFFLNVFVPEPRLIIIGAVHITQSLAAMAQGTGFAVEIIDPRQAFANDQRFNQFDPVAIWPNEYFELNVPDQHTAVAALTHDPKIDDDALLAALRAECFYVGALGSRKSHARRCERLTASGATEAQISRIYAPIGLNIGAANPSEIAVAILAQLIAARRLPLETKQAVHA